MNLFKNWREARLNKKLNDARKLLNAHGWSVVQAIKVDNTTYIRTGTGQLKRVGGKLKVRK